MIHCSTVARLVEVPARGRSEKATFPRGHETSLVIGGVGTTGATIDSAKAGVAGKSVDAAHATTICCSMPLRSGDLMYKSLSFSSAELAYSNNNKIPDCRSNLPGFCGIGAGCKKATEGSRIKRTEKRPIQNAVLLSKPIFSLFATMYGRMFLSPSSSSCVQKSFQERRSTDMAGADVLALLGVVVVRRDPAGIFAPYYL